MAYSISTIAEAVNGELHSTNSDAQVKNILLDSRKLLFPSNTIFFALSTGKRSGNDFIEELYNKGVRNFVTKTNSIDTSNFPEANFVLVENTLRALQSLVAFHRNQFHYPVIGITGSNGKTIVKEWLFQCLNNDYNIVRSPKSYNSQIGVPLSVWEMNSLHTLGIFEAGISTHGEMEKLQPIIKPEIGIFTFLGNAHAEGFENNEAKIDEKLKLFINSKALIYCADEKLLYEKIIGFKETTNPHLQLISWGKGHENFVTVNKIAIGNSNTVISYSFDNKEQEISISLTDEASIHNALTVCTTLHCLGFSPMFVQQKLMELRPVEMRLELLQGINNCSIINDSYSADINSLNIALDFLQQQQQHSKRSLVLSDLLQASHNPEALYKQLAEIVNRQNLFRFVGIGPKMKEYSKFFSLANQSFYLSTGEAISQLTNLHFENETILLKGARVFEFERISTALEQKMHQTVLEINLTALRHNLNVYKAMLSPGVKLMAMVKAFSYGSGSFEIANLLQHAGIDYLAVAYTDEGVSLRKAGIKLPIMVMNIDGYSFENLVKYNLEPELFSLNIVSGFSRFLQQKNIENFPVHIKLDTGMHRLGFEQGDMPALLPLLNKTFVVKSIFSHLAASGDDIHNEFTLLQAEVFEKMALQIEQHLTYPVLKHISNTSAIGRFPQLQYNMVRLGIGLYGVESNAEVQEKLRTVTTFKTTIAQIRKVKQGDSIGYSRRGNLHKDATIATVRVGYADGYARSLGNGIGKMLINGKLAPTIGNVCMDMTMLDISGISAAEEDEVIVFGNEPSVHQLAEWAGTIPYEILTAVSQRVKRVYFEE